MRAQITGIRASIPSAEAVPAGSGESDDTQFLPPPVCFCCFCFCCFRCFSCFCCVCCSFVWPSALFTCARTR